MDEQDTAATSKALMSWWGKDDGLLDKAQVLQKSLKGGLWEQEGGTR